MKEDQQLVVSERTGVDANLVRLKISMLSDAFTQLSEVDQDLLRRQADVMSEYSNVLGKRIARFAS